MKNINVVRIQVIKESGFKYETNAIKNPEIAAEILHKFIDECCNNDRENFIIMCLDTKNKVIALNLNGTGTLNSCQTTAREVFKVAILSNAAGIILAHNHPSGDSSPSKEDMDLTRKMAEAGKLLGIEVLDHIILGDTNTSLKQHGLF